MADPINPYELPIDARSWNHFWEQAVATVTVDAILEDIFQGKRNELREQMLNVAAKRTRRIAWGQPGDINQARRDAILAQAKAIVESRKAGRGDA